MDLMLGKYPVVIAGGIAGYIIRKVLFFYTRNSARYRASGRYSYNATLWQPVAT